MNAGLGREHRQTFYTVDRIEGDLAVLVGDDGAAIDIRRTTLPVRVRAGIVLRVRLGNQGTPDWASCMVDDAERERRLADVRERLARLRDRDPGGDVVL